MSSTTWRTMRIGPGPRSQHSSVTIPSRSRATATKPISSSTPAASPAIFRHSLALIGRSIRLSVAQVAEREQREEQRAEEEEPEAKPRAAAKRAGEADAREEEHEEI